MTPDNPKKLYGDKKPPLHLLPLSGQIEQSLAHMDGDLKYGFENWNDMPVEKLTYIGAAMRHLGLYKYGETHARDTGVHNLGAVMACCAILIDAELHGTLIDNAKPNKAVCDLLHSAEALVERIKQADRERKAEGVLAVFDAPPLDPSENVHDLTYWRPINFEAGLEYVEPKYRYRGGQLYERR